MSGLWQQFVTRLGRTAGSVQEGGHVAASAAAAAPSNEGSKTADEDSALVAAVAKEAVVVKHRRGGRRKARHVNVVVVDDAPAIPDDALLLYQPSSSNRSGEKKESRAVGAPSTANNSGNEAQVEVRAVGYERPRLRVPVAPGGRVRPWETVDIRRWSVDGRGKGAEVFEYLVRLARVSLWRAGGRVEALTAQHSAQTSSHSNNKENVAEQANREEPHKLVVSSAFSTPTQRAWRTHEPQAPTTAAKTEKGEEMMTMEKAVEHVKVFDESSGLVDELHIAKDKHGSEEEQPAGQAGQGVFVLLFQKRRADPATNTRCPGCGALLDASSSRRCEYTGKQYCGACMAPERCCIPGYVVYFWDRRPYDVCRAAFDGLQCALCEPLVSISALNPMLRKMVPVVGNAVLLRRKLFHLRHFVSTCTRMAPGSAEAVALARLPAYYTDKADVFSLADLLGIQALVVRLLATHRQWLAHVARCELCRGKGSYCEICRTPRLIFPFEIVSVVQCRKCFGVYHRACFAAQRFLCPKCARRHARTVLQTST